MRVGSGLANGVRQYAVTVTTTWQQLENDVSGSVVAASGLAPSMPVLRWKGQAGTSTTTNTNNYDYPQGILIQNRDATATLYVSTTKDPDGADPSTATVRSVAYAVAVGPGSSLKLDCTDASKIWLAGSGTLIAAILGN